MVLEAVLDDVLTPDIVDEAVTEAMRILQPKDGGDGQLALLAKEMSRVEGERSRLADAIATGGDLDGLLMAELKAARSARVVQLAQGDRDRPKGLDVRRVRIERRPRPHAARTFRRELKQWRSPS